MDELYEEPCDDDDPWDHRVDAGGRCTICGGVQSRDASWDHWLCQEFDARPARSHMKEEERMDEHFFDEPEMALYSIYVNAFSLPESERPMFMARYREAQDSLLDWLGLERSEEIRQAAIRAAAKEG
jgi:hypothetical protein